MTKREAKQLPLGIYLIYWKSGGQSVAAVGQDEKGCAWLAPANWIKVPSFDHWGHVKRTELRLRQSCLVDCCD